MSHKNRGYALIFNHEYYENNAHSARDGTNIDCKSLRDTLTNLQFEVYTYKDQSRDQIFSIMTKMSTVDHSESDCILIVVMSHGERGTVFAYDYEYTVESFTSLFTADRCPSLAGKPKLFFIQACRGKQVDRGAKVSSFIQADSVSQTKYEIPVQADFLIAYSSWDGFLSYRHPDTGSWFIQSLCEQLRTYGTRYNIHQILTIVNRKVSEGFHENNSDRLYQIPSVTYSLKA